MANDEIGRKIEFRVVGFSPNVEVYETVATVISKAVEQMHLPEQDLRSVIIADDDQYGPAIKQFIPAEGYTNDKNYRGIGKILPHYENGQYVCCNLVLHYCVVASFVESKDTSPTGEVDAMRYCLYHELGHCVDYRRRPVTGRIKEFAETNSVVLRCANANTETVVSEYAACLFSAQFVTPEAFRYLIQQTADTLSKCFDALASKRQLYRVHLLELPTLCNEVLTAYWRGLTEVAKLYAYQNGNGVLRQESALSWPRGTEATTSILNDFGSQLADDWSHYPDCLDSFKKTLLTAFFPLTEAEGYKFAVKPKGDYLWLV